MGKTILTTKNGSTSLITMGTGEGKAGLGVGVGIVDGYVPIGATLFSVKTTAGLVVGGDVYVQRGVTPEWVRANGMSDLVRDGKAQVWLEVSSLFLREKKKRIDSTNNDQDGHTGAKAKEVIQPRKIVNISGNIITIDIPLTDALDSLYMSPLLIPYTPPASSSEMGLENLSITLSPTCSGKILTDVFCQRAALTILPWSTNSFAHSLNITGYHSFITVSLNTSRHTLSNISMHRDGPTNNGAGYAGGIAISGTQILVSDCSAYGELNAKFYAIWTTTLTPGPNAVLRFFSQQASFIIQPHMRWAHGFLVDNSTTPLEFRNRDTAGSGHGWAISGGVRWNVKGKFDLRVESPPLGVHWCVGCEGEEQMGSNGTFVEYGREVSPVSLFEAQLAARRGR